MTTPTTAAGRRLFTDIEPMDMFESDGVTWTDVLAIEAEAAAAERARIRAAVEGLPCGGNHKVGYCTGVIWKHGDVLALLEPQP